MPERCLNCGKPVTKDEIGLSRKLINRGTNRFLCLECMARKYEATVPELEEKIRQFRSMGCTLFTD